MIIRIGCVNGNLTLNDQDIHKLTDVDNYVQQGDIENDIMPPGHEVVHAFFFVRILFIRIMRLKS